MTTPRRKAPDLPDLKSAALQYARDGFAVFPCAPLEKHPLTKSGVKEATTNLEQIERWWTQHPDANIGFEPASACLLAVDYDNGSNPEAVAKQYGLPLTGLIVGTPRGGEHEIFSIPAGVRIPPSASKIAPRVDIRGSDSYTLLPPSRTKDGPYTWIERGQASPAPQALIDAATAGRRAKAADPGKINVPEDQPHNIEAYSTWLAREAKPAIEGQGGNNRLTATGACGRSFALNAETAVNLAWNIYNPRCDPPWRDDEYEDFERTITSGHRSASSDQGNLTEDWRKLKTQERIDATRRLFEENQKNGTNVGPTPAKPEGLFDGPDYAERPAPKWIIPGAMTEESYSIASGRSQAGKTFGELPRELSICTGQPWLGLSIETMGPTLYVAAEGQGRIWKDVRAWCAEFNVDPETLRGKFFIFDRGARLNTNEGREALQAVLEYIKNVTGRYPISVTFDTLRRNMRGGVSQEEPTSDVLHAVNELLAQGIAVTLVAHHGRGHGESKGLTDWEDDADQVRHYSGTVRNDSTVVTFHKVKQAEDGWALAVEYITHEFPDRTTTKVAIRGTRVAAPDSEIVEGAGAMGRANTYADVLERVLLESKSQVLGPSATAHAMREMLRADGHKPPNADTIRKKFLYKVRDAVEGEHEYVAAWLVHSRDRLAFSHPDRISGVNREPRPTRRLPFKPVVHEGGQQRPRHRKPAA
jgi:hypothetical protein